MYSKVAVRESAVVELPEQFVTVEIHNTTAKRKMRNLRESIIQEMKHTEDLLEQTLNRTLHPKSKFSPSAIQTPTPTSTQDHTDNRKLPLLTCSSTPRNTTSRNRLLRVGGEVARKLKQLCNISQHFDLACQYSKRVIPTIQFNAEASYSLPIATPPPPPSPAECKAQEQLAQHRTLIRDWQSKAKLGREFVKRAKLKHPLRIRDLNREEGERKKTAAIGNKSSLKSLRDVYYSKIHPERKTAPLPSNNLELLFLEQREKSKRSGIGYVGTVEEEPMKELQKFMQGGQESSFNEFSSYFNLGEFRRSKEKFKTLSKLYDHVVENNMFQFKDMSPDRFNSQSLLAVVYYLENSSNLTENERRSLRKRLKVIE